MESIRLTKSEKQVMEAFWQVGQPLSHGDLLLACAQRSWKDKSCFMLINRLLTKGLLKTVGYKRSGKTYARTFAPAMSRVEYWAEIVKEENMSSSQLMELTVILSDAAKTTT